MGLNANLAKFLFKKKIDITEFCGGESHFIELREPNIAEFKEIGKLQNIGNGSDLEKTLGAAETFNNQLNTLIVNHDFYEDADTSKKLSSKEVAALVESKLDLTIFIIGEYMTALPLVSKTG